jgi:hypothetical protein
MTEQEWKTCTDPRPMLEFLAGKASDRKLRLFAVACCRRTWQLLTDEQSRHAVAVAERYADAQATEDELETASAAACAVWDAEMEQPSTDREKVDEQDGSFVRRASLAAYNVAVPLGWWGAAPAFVAPDEVAREVAPNSETEATAQCELLRDIFGNPFRPITVDPAWRTLKVVNLAETIYDNRTFDRLPVLAAALEQAGCNHAEILGHCREPGPHVKGCWVVDLVLGKE